MSFQQSGGLSRERPSLVINHFVFAKNGWAALAVPACTLWGTLYPNYLGYSVFRTRAALDTTFWPNIMAKNGYEKWLFTYFPALHASASYPPGNLLLSLWPLQLHQWDRSGNAPRRDHSESHECTRFTQKIPPLETKMGHISACVLCSPPTGGSSAVAGVGGWRFSLIPHDPQLLNRPCLFLKWMLFFSFGLCSIEAILQHGLVPIFCLWTIIFPQWVLTSVSEKHNATTVGQQSDWKLPALKKCLHIYSGISWSFLWIIILLERNYFCSVFLLFLLLRWCKLITTPLAPRMRAHILQTAPILPRSCHF